VGQGALGGPILRWLTAFSGDERDRSRRQTLHLALQRGLPLRRTLPLAVKRGHPGTSGTVSSSNGSSGESGPQVTRAPSPGDIGPAPVGSREENILAGAQRSPNGDGG